MAAMGMGDKPIWLQTMDEIAGQGDLGENLVRLGVELIAV